MKRIHSFAAVENMNARVLILGSMPGEASLSAGEYYAHPRNHFWRMMQSLISLDAAATYPQRIVALQQARIALWDVLHSCTRAGSLDSSINKASQTPNDFAAFFLRHPEITHVFFNGRAAEQVYRKSILPGLNVQPLEYLCLPSTSPANAMLSFEQKQLAWRALLAPLQLHATDSHLSTTA